MAEKNYFIGKLVGNYRIIKELKSGSFGSVYQAKHRVFDDNPVVAIKLLHAHLNSPQEHEQFLLEARLLNKLKHPHILPVLDAGIQDNMPYIVMEYASGGSLKDRLDKQAGTPLPINEALAILTDIGQALQHAHQQNIVHCDLKPDNVLFNARNEALLADFGVAVMLATIGTQQVGLRGTYAYMAPEQFEGFASVKSDQYALGCITYELVTGRRPFIAPAQAMWYQHAQVKPTPPTTLNTHVPKYIEQAILKALAKNRADRHADVATFISALHKSSEQWFQDGNALQALNRYEEAIAAYNQAIRLNPKDAAAYLKKSNAFYNLKRYEDARAAYDQAVYLSLDDEFDFEEALFSAGVTFYPPSIYDRQLDPEDPSDLPFHPHEKPFPAPGEFNSLRFDWQIVGASRRGYGHAYLGKYREDDFSVRLISAGVRRNGQGHEMALIAIADGVSSKKLSRRGARAVVKGATSLPDRHFYPLMSMVAQQATRPQLEQEAYKLLMDAMSAANKNVTARAKESHISVDELQSTLLVYLIAPWGERNLLVASTQIGDGALFVHQLRNSEQWNWLQAPQIQGSGNEVQPFMRSGSEDWGKFFRIEFLENVSCIMGMTDGIADDIVGPRATQGSFLMVDDKNPDPFSMVDDFYQRIVVPSLVAAQPEEVLMDGIGYQKKRSHDDRTVVCLYHR